MRLLASLLVTSGLVVDGCGSHTSVHCARPDSECSQKGNVAVSEAS